MFVCLGAVQLCLCLAHVGGCGCGQGEAGGGQGPGWLHVREQTQDHHRCLGYHQGEGVWQDGTRGKEVGLGEMRG